jgi:hypothetical protein
MTKTFGQPLFITNPFSLFASLFALAAFTASAIHASPAVAAPADIAACDGLAGAYAAAGRRRSD